METEKKTDGAFLGLVIIVIILVVGGLYIWQSKVKQIEIQKTALTAEDVNSLNDLEQSVNNTNANVGVDVNSLK